MKYPKLIILYGRFQENQNWKQQRMIDGGATCMYREFAKKFGEIIYLAPQNCNESWERSIVTPWVLLKYLKQQPDAIVWSVKHCPDKDIILQNIPNRKVYYSCCAYNMYNRYCDVSLVDLPERVQQNAILWVKGKDPNYWLPSKYKSIDILIMGARADKNEIFFLKEMQRTKSKYTIQWIGGKSHQDRITFPQKHDVLYTSFLSMSDTRNMIPNSKVGVILSEHPAEGFPQSFLEMTMCGLPVIYLFRNKPNRAYANNYVGIVDKHSIPEVVEKVLSRWTPEYSAYAREYAVANYSLEKSYESILKGLSL